MGIKQEAQTLKEVSIKLYLRFQGLDGGEGFLPYEVTEDQLIIAPSGTSMVLLEEEHSSVSIGEGTFIIIRKDIEKD